MPNAHRRHLANAIRALAMDAVQKANSGHPGMPMGMADIAEVLWNGHLRHNPGNPQWPRFHAPIQPAASDWLSSDAR
jgi:transketolase